MLWNFFLPYFFRPIHAARAPGFLAPRRPSFDFNALNLPPEPNLALATLVTQLERLLVLPRLEVPVLPGRQLELLVRVLEAG